MFTDGFCGFFLRYVYVVFFAASKSLMKVVSGFMSASLAPRRRHQRPIKVCPRPTLQRPQTQATLRERRLHQGGTARRVRERSDGVCVSPPKVSTRLTLNLCSAYLWLPVGLWARPP